MKLEASVSDQTKILRRIAWILPMLALLVYWPVFDNGFISDDYVILERAQTWQADGASLVYRAPENFRSTTYLAFRILKNLFGYNPAIFYLFTVLLHAVNALLLAYLVKGLTGDRWYAACSAILFVAFRNPQEAVMWLSGMNELLLGSFLLLTLNFWIKERYVWSLVFYCLALFSKESAPAILILLPLLDLWKGKRPLLRSSHLVLIIPTVFYSVVFVLTATENNLLTQGFYEAGFHAVFVFLKSLHRLAFPWLYLAFAAALIHRKPVTRAGVVIPLAWVGATLVPYIFLTYQDHVTSRHQYLASMGVAMSIAYLVTSVERKRLAAAFMVVFLLGNAGYIWFRKDTQFEERAAPTNALLTVLEQHSPEPILLERFPLNPWIAKLTTRLASGWEPEMVKIAELGEFCQDCPVLEWDERKLDFTVAPP